MIAITLLLNIALAFSPQADTLTAARADSLLATRGAEVRLACLERAEAEAAASQARRWENPEVEALYNIYNPVTARWLDPGREGEVDIALSQPLPIGRRHRVAAAEAAWRAAEATEGWTLFAMRMQARREMGQALAAEERAGLVGRELECVDRVLAAWRRTPQAVPPVEVRRMETLRLALLAEQAERQHTVAECRAALAATLGLDTADFVLPPLRLADAPDTLPRSEQPLLVAGGRQIEAAEATLRFERTQAWPRVSLGVEYDKNGNIGHNFWAVGATLTLPLFDRNRAGIRTAELAVERRRVEHEQQRRTLGQAEALAARRLRDARRLADEAALLAQWDIDAVERQYLARNIGLMEFVDLLTAYREAQEVAVDTRLALLLAAIDHNLALGHEKHIIN